MNIHSQATPETVNARLTPDVTYLLNGEAAPEMLARLQACANAPSARGC